MRVFFPQPSLQDLKELHLHAMPAQTPSHQKGTDSNTCKPEVGVLMSALTPLMPAVRRFLHGSAVPNVQTNSAESTSCTLEQWMEAASLTTQVRKHKCSFYLMLRAGKLAPHQSGVEMLMREQYKIPCRLRGDHNRKLLGAALVRDQCSLWLKRGRFTSFLRLLC